MKFLMGHNESSKGLKAQILLIKPFPNLNEVYSIIQQEEKWRKISSDEPNNEALALLVKDSGKQINARGGNVTKRYYYSHCEIQDHSLERCFKANPNKPECSHCHMHGHATNACYKIPRYAKGHKFYGKSKVVGVYASQISSTISQALGAYQNTTTQEQHIQLSIIKIMLL